MIEFSASEFRAQFPGQFPDPPTSDELLELYWNTAICYISPVDEGALNGSCRRKAINLVTAHLITLAGAATLGKQAGFIESASIDKISVTFQSFTSKTELRWWYNQTIYGQQALAMLLSKAQRGYMGGFNELGSFRRAGGVFTPPGGESGLVEGVGDVCSHPTAPPPTPYDLDFGVLDNDSATLQAVIPAACDTLACVFGAGGNDRPVTISVWNGLEIDNGFRMNVFYWDTDERFAGSPPTNTSENADPTGVDQAGGFSWAGLFSGALGANQNLFALQGFSATSTQLVNINIFAG